MINIKEFASGLFQITTEIVISIPLHFIRSSYIRMFIGSLGQNSELCRNIDIRSPRRIRIGDYTVSEAENLHILWVNAAGFIKIL